MKIRYLLSTGIMVLVSVFIAAGLYAGTNVPNVIKLKTAKYAEHKKKIVKFDHRKNQQDYRQKFPDLYQNDCGECHHDQNNQPRTELKAGMEVKKCIECHKTPQHVTGKEAKKLSTKEQRQFHANALHENCKACHKKINEATGKKTAPTTCKKCHRA